MCTGPIPDFLALNLSQWEGLVTSIFKSIHPHEILMCTQDWETLAQAFSHLSGSDIINPICKHICWLLKANLRNWLKCKKRSQRHHTESQCFSDPGPQLPNPSLWPLAGLPWYNPGPSWFPVTEASSYSSSYKPGAVLILSNLFLPR